jgi:hypothetical protein
LHDFTVPDGITSIGEYGFVDCPLGTLKLPSTLTIIGLGAFMSSGLTNVTIPSSVIDLEDSAFAHSSIASLTIPGSVRSIADNAFLDCESLTNVVIASGVTNIGNAAFYNCVQLAAVSMPTTLASIGGSAFEACGSLAGITIPRSVGSIADDAFKDCSGLSWAICLGDPPITGSGVFESDDRLTVYYLSGTSGWNSEIAGRPAVLWNPQFQALAPEFGVGTNGFGFTVGGTADIPFVIVASTNLTHSHWQLIQTYTLSNTAVYFSDPQSGNYSTRFYRIMFP